MSMMQYQQQENTTAWPKQEECICKLPYDQSRNDTCNAHLPLHPLNMLPALQHC